MLDLESPRLLHDDVGRVFSLDPADYTPQCLPCSDDGPVARSVTSQRLAARYGPLADQACAGCGRPASRWVVDLESPRLLHDGVGRAYSPDPADYTPQCLPCSDRGPTTYAAAYQRLTDRRGPAAGQVCAGCGGPASRWVVDLESPRLLHDDAGRNYSADPADYTAQCRTCLRAAVAAQLPLFDLR